MNPKLGQNVAAFIIVMGVALVVLLVINALVQ